ncbi:MAG: 3-keto-disaccharide hydrolase [Thermoguttaceae bacterium]
MTKRSLLVALGCAALVWTACAISTTTIVVGAEADKDGFTPIFDGKTLDGWEGPKEFWSVKDGMIVAESTPEKLCKATNYLFYTKEKFGNFVFRAKFRLVGAGGNSGVQFRTEPNNNTDARGYQADIDRDGQWIGCLYEQGGRGIWGGRGFEMTESVDGKQERKQFADPAELLKVYKVDDWNDYEITADGPKLTVKLNGKLMCSVVDHNEKESRATGVIGFQMHQGPPMKVEYKDVKIKTLKK